LALALVRDLREHRAPASIGRLADSTIRNDTNQWS
jgi:hypothetical protein